MKKEILEPKETSSNGSPIVSEIRKWIKYFSTTTFDDFVQYLIQKPLSVGQPVRYIGLGPSGVGKSWLLDELTTHTPDTTLLDLDFFGSKIAGKWVVDISALQESVSDNRNVIVTGTSDNIGDVIKALPTFTPFLIIPNSLEDWKRMQRAKYEGSSEKALPIKWRLKYLSRTLTTLPALGKILARNITPAPKLGIILPSLPADPIQGWHQIKV